MRVQATVVMNGVRGAVRGENIVFENGKVMPKRAFGKWGATEGLDGTLIEVPDAAWDYARPRAEW